MGSCLSRCVLSPCLVDKKLAEHLKVLLSILIGPAAARPGGQCSGAGGYADILNLQTLTVPSLAFGAAVVGPHCTSNDMFISFSLHRHASPYLLRGSVVGRSVKRTRQGSIIWISIKKSSWPLGSGGTKISDRFSCGGIGASLPLPSDLC